jgi:formate-dependent nitrite reductase membrane component NrfD
MTAIAASDYYGRPLLKKPVWKPVVPLYFFAGGVAGAAMTMGMAVHHAGEKRLAARCRWAGAIGGGIGSALLIYDLGRMTRFLYMLRVFRPTSPMSVGSWVLALATPASLGSVLLNSEFLGDVAGVLGMPLATYTGVLIGNTAIPVWYRSRRMLPVLFGASSMTGMASVFELMPLRRSEQAIIHRFGLIGRTAELAAGAVMEKEFRRYTGRLWRAATVLTAASLAVSLLAGKSATKRRISGVLGILGSIAMRFAVVEAANSVDARKPS